MILGKQLVCEPNGPFDGESSKMHDAEFRLLRFRFMYGIMSDERARNQILQRMV